MDEKMEPAAVETAPEPTIDLDSLRFEAGHPAELVAHIKEWVEWRLKQ